MATAKYILVKQYCEYSNIEDDFILKLHEYGIVNFEDRDKELFLNENDIVEVERNFRLHRDLGINYEGLDALKQMLRRVSKMENEISRLENKLKLFQ